MSAESHTQSPPIVVLGVTGCIAAYKACEVARALMRHGCSVKVVMTENATRFVGTATFRALTGNPVAVALWDEPDSRVHHISLAEQAEVFAIVPATANVIAKLACGRADDLLTTSALATEAPIVVAPAMNVHMWRAEVTQANVSTLRGRGVVIVEPVAGELACGEVGEGRLAEVDDIVAAIMAEVDRSLSLEGVNVLVTAGPTHEPIDPVRFIGNASSGRTGFAIAEEASRRGARVTLVSGPTNLADPFGVDTRRVSTAAEMHAAVAAAYPQADVVVATAAVSDYRPATPRADKLKKSEDRFDLVLERTPDILAGLGSDKGDRMLVGFAAETSNVIEYARAKLSDKNLDVVVANDVSDPEVGFGSLSNRVWVVTPDGVEELPLQSKSMIACGLWDRLAGRAREASARRAKGDRP